MKRPILLISLITILYPLAVHAVVWEFHNNGDTEGWFAGNQVANFGVSGDTLTFDTTGGDPFIYSPDNLNVSGSNFRYLHADIEYTSSSNQSFQVFFITTTDASWNEAKSFRFTGYIGRQTYLINIPQTLSAEGKDPNSWLGKTIRQVRFDPGSLSGCNVKIHWFGITFGSNSRGAVWDFETNGDFEGWGGFNHATNQQVTGGYLYFEFTGNDPFVQSPGDLRISGSDYPWLQADIEYYPSNNSFQMFYTTSASGEGGFAEERSIIFSAKPGRYTYLVNIPQRLAEEGKPGVWNGRTIMQIRFDTGWLYPGNIRIYYIGLRREPIPDWQFDVGGQHKQGWTAVNQISNLTVTSDALSCNTTGADPHIQVYNLHFNPSAYRYLLLRANITNYENNAPALMQTFGFPGTGGTGFVQKDYYFYPNNGYQCLLVDMGTRTSNSSWLGPTGTISSFRIDPATVNTSATFYYDYITLYDSLSWATGPYTWDFSTAGNNSLYGSNCGNWVSAKHSPYNGTSLSIASGLATVTGSATLGIENLGFIIGAPSTYRWLQIDINPTTQIPRNDFTLRFAWRKDGLRLGDDYDTARKWTIPTNIGIKRYNFLIPYTTGQPSGHTGTWDGFPHGILLQFGEGETDINSVTIDNVSILSDSQVPAPTVTAVNVSGQRIVDVTFSQQMDTSTISTSSFTISGTGKGTLSSNPYSVAYLSGHTYRLTWLAGEMRDGGDVTITVATSVKDAAGRNLTSPNSATHTGGGIKIDTPTISSVTSPPAVNTTPITISYTGASDASSGVSKVELWYKKETTGTWTYSGLSSVSAPNGSFSFSPALEGTYYFDVVVEDGAGNRSDLPTGNGRTSTMYDITVPVLGSITVPAYTNQNPVSVVYSGVVDNLSGAVSYRLYYKLGAGGVWTDVGVNLIFEGGIVDFSIPGNVEGVYYLALRAVDLAGNDTGAPVGNGLTSFMYDVTRPLNLSSVSIAPEYVNDSGLPVRVSYTGAADALSGLDYVRLWYRKGLGGVWTDTGLTLTTPDGTFNFNPPAGEGTYYLLVQPVDRAGNGRYVSGNGDGTTIYDNTPPVVGIVNTPDYASGAGVSVGYTSASDGSEGSGVLSYRLWYKLGDTGSWTEYGVPLNVSGGNITFAPPGGTNGRYYFDLRACDSAGNCSAMPSGNGQDSSLYDTVLPVNGVASSPAYSRWPVVVNYSGASDALSGLDFVRLYYKRGSGSWTATALTSSSGSGSFSFTGSQDGVYYFAVVARDKAGNTGSLPSGNGDTMTVVDTVLPTVGSLEVVNATRTLPVVVNYSGCSDNVGGSGLDLVKLWYKLGDSGVWTDSGLSSGSGSGSFNFSGVTVDGRYYFGLEVIDKCGNSTGVPTGNGLGSVLVDRTAPVLGSISLTSPTNIVPISVGYSGCVDAGVGLSLVRLWYRYGDSGEWTDSGLSSTSGSGSFNFAGVVGDGVYYFGLQALDTLGNDTGIPTGNGLGSVLVDRSAPEVTVEPMTVTDRTPELRGTVSDLSGVVELKVQVGGYEYDGVVVGEQWTALVTNPLRRGVYDVQVTATDVLGQVGVDSSVGELFVDVEDPWVTVDSLVTNDPTPLLSGEMGPAREDLEVVRVTVRVGSYEGMAELDREAGRWSMEVLEPLEEGVYDVYAEVEDSGGNMSWDTTEDELVIDLTPPELEVMGPEPSETRGEPVRYVVRYRGVSEVRLGAEDVELMVRNGEVTADVAVNRIGKADRDEEYEIVLSNFSGNGEVALHILPGTAIDEAGNIAGEYIGGYTLRVQTEFGVPIVGIGGLLVLVVVVMYASCRAVVRTEGGGSSWKNRGLR